MTPSASKNLSMMKALKAHFLKATSSSTTHFVETYVI